MQLVRHPGNGQPPLRYAMEQLANSYEWKSSSDGTSLMPGGRRWLLAAGLKNRYESQALRQVRLEYPTLDRQIQMVARMRGAAIMGGEQGVQQCRICLVVSRSKDRLAGFTPTLNLRSWRRHRRRGVWSRACHSFSITSQEKEQRETAKTFSSTTVAACGLCAHVQRDSTHRSYYTSSPAPSSWWFNEGSMSTDCLYCPTSWLANIETTQIVLNVPYPRIGSRGDRSSWGKPGRLPDRFQSLCAGKSARPALLPLLDGHSPLAQPSARPDGARLQAR